VGPETIEKLKKYAGGKENILLAIIFGSQAKGLAGEDSDLDIAVFLKNKEEEDKIWSEISKITEKEIDLIVLNDAPATLISNIFKTGMAIAVRDKKLYWDLFLKNSLEAEDFSDFALDYWEIYLRSKSLIPEDRVRLIERINFLTEEFKEIEGFRGLTFQNIVTIS
jgi:predicted nucleotidyltransferase